jgi:hypothetical protein
MIVNLADRERSETSKNAPPTGITLVTKFFYGPVTDQNFF